MKFWRDFGEINPTVKFEKVSQFPSLKFYPLLEILLTMNHKGLKLYEIMTVKKNRILRKLFYLFFFLVQLVFANSSLNQEIFSKLSVLRKSNNLKTQSSFVFSILI